MSICNALTNGLQKSCDNNSGGVNKVFLADFANATPILATSSTFPNDEWINAITMAAPGGVTASFYEIQTNKNVCNFQETVAIDLTNGTTFFNQVVNIVLSRRETTKRAFIEKLIAGQKQLACIVLDSNGIYWYFGLEEGGYITAIDGGSGTAKADANGYTVTLTAMEPDQAYQVNPAIITNITSI